MSVIINGTGSGGFIVLKAPLTLFVRTVPVTVTLSNGSPCVANWPNHGLHAADPVVFSSPYDRGVCTITIANPGVVTLANHGYALNDPIAFDTSGALPTGLAVGTIFFAIPLTVNTFNVAAAPNGAAINTGGAQSGIQYVFRVNTIPSGVGDGIIYFVLSVIDANNFTFSKTINGAAINTTSAQVGKVIGQTGNDNNNGLTQTRGGAFMTVGKAWREICGFYNLNSQVITVQLAHGTYFGGSFSDNTSADTDNSPCFCSNAQTAAVAVFWLGGGEVLFLGDASNPDAVKFLYNGNAGIFRGIDANCDFDGNLTFKGLRIDCNADAGHNGFSVDYFQAFGFNTIILDTINFGYVFGALGGSGARMWSRAGICQLITQCQVMANAYAFGQLIQTDQSGTWFCNSGNFNGGIIGVNNPTFYAIYQATDNGFVKCQLNSFQGTWTYTAVCFADGQGFVFNHQGNNPPPSATPQFSGQLNDRAFYFEFTSPSAQTSAQFGAPGCPVDTFYLYLQPITGFSQTLNNSHGHVVLDPAGTIATGTIVMTPNPTQGQQTNIRTSQTITTMTFTPNAGQAVLGAPTTLAAGQMVEAIFVAANSTWYFGT